MSTAGSDNRVIIVGAGLAGLAAAVRLSRKGRQVELFEAAGQAGGRCRSFHDSTMDMMIDNGNHLLFSGNHAAMDYLKTIGALDTLCGPDQASFDFFDLETGERWSVRPGPGRSPLWLFDSTRRVPGTSARHYLEALKLKWAGPEQTVSDCLNPDGPLFRRFWEPFAVAALNASVDDGAAALLWPVILETFGRGESYCRPRMARTGLSDSFINPALGYLEGRGATLHFNTRLRAISTKDSRVETLDFGGHEVGIGPENNVVLAVPPTAAAALVPGLETPRGTQAIVNLHFRLSAPVQEESILGLVGGTAQWVFVRGSCASVTISAANDIVELPAEIVAGRVWPEVARALDMNGAPCPQYRVLKEKRATFAQTPTEVLRRPAAKTRWSNFVLAGDWTDTGLPATIEGAIRSGHSAAALV